MVDKLMKSFVFSLFTCLQSKKKVFKSKKVLTHGFYGMLEKGFYVLNKPKIAKCMPQYLH